MANITDDISRIRAAIYGGEVRESIANGIEGINTEVTSTTARQTTVEQEQNALETTFNALVINAGNENAEIVLARGAEVSLPVRLNKVDSTLANISAQFTDITQVFSGAGNPTQLDIDSMSAGDIFVVYGGAYVNIGAATIDNSIGGAWAQVGSDWSRIIVREAALYATKYDVYVDGIIVLANILSANLMTDNIATQTYVTGLSAGIHSVYVRGKDDIGNVGIPSNTLSITTKTVVKDYNFTTSVEGFTAPNGSTPTILGGNFHTTAPLISATDILSPDLTSLAIIIPSQAKYFEISYRISAVGTALDGNIYFTTTTDTAIDANKTFATWTYAGTPGFIRLLIPASSSAQWTGTLKQLILRFFNSTTGTSPTIDIDFVRILN